MKIEHALVAGALALISIGGATHARKGQGWAEMLSVNKSELVTAGKNPYFILDFRAIESLGIPMPNSVHS